LIKGIDIFEGDTGMPSWSDMWDAGFRYVFYKTKDFGSASPHRADSLIAPRLSERPTTGIICGFFSLVHNNAGSPEDHDTTAVGMLKRLVSGDVVPSLDMEDRDPTHTKVQSFWADFANRYLDAIGTSLWRPPIIHTSRNYWKEFTDNPPDLAGYPLCLIDSNNAVAAIPPVWTRWTFWQWHTEISGTDILNSMQSENEPWETM
jgi:hypothetical protein